jgi:hypothetical protein
MLRVTVVESEIVNTNLMRKSPLSQSVSGERDTLLRETFEHLVTLFVGTTGVASSLPIRRKDEGCLVFAVRDILVYAGAVFVHNLAGLTLCVLVDHKAESRAPVR